MDKAINDRISSSLHACWGVSSSCIFGFPIYRNDSDVKKVGHFIQKQSYLGHCKTGYSNRKRVLISSQDSRWIIVFKYNGGVLYYMFFYSLVIAQSLRIHILCSDFLCVWQAVVLMEYVWTFNAKSLDFHEMTVLLFTKCVRLHSSMKTNLICVQPALFSWMCEELAIVSCP